MDIDITLVEFEKLNENLIVEPNGHTNKKCPRCGCDIVIESKGKSYTMRCRTQNCIALDFRGI